MEIFDLRSDTVTRPTEAMRAAMARAEVGDDVYGEDPTVRRLEETVAALLGKDAALFVPSGTMCNQIALKVLTRPGDEVVIGEGAHCAVYEAGAAAALSGVQFAIAGKGGLFGADDLDDAVKPKQFYHPRTSLVALENTHNRAGGRIFPQADVLSVADRARQMGLRLHLDGARLWNAAVATGLDTRTLSEPFDTVGVCFSKGLGAPVGSALSGERSLIEEARRVRRMLGGAMRQTGILAAGALWALENHRDRLVEDHRAAQRIAEILDETPGAHVEVAHVETNIVNVELDAPRAADVSGVARTEGVLVNATSRRTLRAVTHLDIPAARAEAAALRLSRVIAAVTGLERND